MASSRMELFLSAAQTALGMFGAIALIGIDEMYTRLEKAVVKHAAAVETLSTTVITTVEDGRTGIDKMCAGVDIMIASVENLSTELENLSRKIDRVEESVKQIREYQSKIYPGNRLGGNRVAQYLSKLNGVKQNDSH